MVCTLHGSLDPLRVDAILAATLEVVVNISTTVTQQPTTTAPSQLTPEDLATRRNPVYGEVEAALQSYTHIDRPPPAPPAIATTGRDPAYGDELSALENYSHIDPPNPSARGPQFFPDTLTDTLKVLVPSPTDNDINTSASHTKLDEQPQPTKPR